MKKPEIPRDEFQRLTALQRYKILDTPAEREFDDLVAVAQLICNTPIAMVSLVDESRQWFKAKIGLNIDETPRELAFCAHAIHHAQVFAVENTLEDERFFDNPMVGGDPHIRFYAGAPLITEDEYALGTLCVIDTKPNRLNPEQTKALEALARQIVQQMELRRINCDLVEQNKTNVRLLGTLSHDLRSPFNGLLTYSDMLLKKGHAMKPERITRIAENISTTSHAAYEQLDNLLSWCKSQMNAVTYEMQSVSLSSLFTDVKDVLQGKARDKNIELVSETPTNCNVKADRNLLTSILHNLLTNAIKFSHRDSTVTLGAEREENTQVRVTVNDNGVGLSRTHIDDLLQSTKIVSNPGTSGESGSGLGLVLVKQHLALMSSRLEIASEAHKGSRFSFLLCNAELDGSGRV